MFKGKLLEFQDLHEKSLLRKCDTASEVILEAPTGSGKTVLMCKFIDDFLEDHSDTIFLWLCPGRGGLESQSQDVFASMTEGIPDGDVYDFIAETHPTGHVYFINWDKLNRRSNVVLRENERGDLMSRIHYCKRNGWKFFIIIDEEHQYRETADRFINDVQPNNIVRASATPNSQGCVEIIEDDEVIAAGLIAEGISVNEGVSLYLQENNNLDDDLMLVELADKKRREIQQAYSRLGLRIRPLVLIQFPNGSQDWIDRIKDKLEDIGYSSNSGLVTEWFSGDHPSNPEEIKKLDGEYSFLLFKQAVATGWDCPRAKILVKLREGGTEAFNIQTIGRIRRMPERRHYDDALLDNCYIYTLDSQFSEGLRTSMSDSFYTYMYKKKEDAPNMCLIQERLDGNDKIVPNSQAVVKAIRNRMLQECDINNDGCLDKEELTRAKGYTFGTLLKAESVEGTARYVSDVRDLNRISAGSHQISNKHDGFIIRDAKRRIARAASLPENISNEVLKILFGPMSGQEFFDVVGLEDRAFERENKIIHDLNLREFNAFVVNNVDRLIDVFGDTNVSDMVVLREAPIISETWSIPSEQYYKFHKAQEDTSFLTKNVFERYGRNSLVPPNRSHTEIVFEEWCERYDPVRWVYKNGDKGEIYFSTVYRRGYARAHFFPDYIIQLENGDVWIIEAKGGQSSDGSSANIDKYASYKFESLKEYAERHHEIYWGFIRAIGQQLYLSNTVWDEDVTNRNIWKPIEVFI